MADGTPGWVEVRLIGPQGDVRRLARALKEERETRTDSGAVGPRRDGRFSRSLVVRDWPVEPPRPAFDGERMLKPAEAAKALGVDPDTLRTWATAGEIRFILTPGGRRMFPESSVQAVMRGENPAGDAR